MGQDFQIMDATQAVWEITVRVKLALRTGHTAAVAAQVVVAAYGIKGLLPGFDGVATSLLLGMTGRVVIKGNQTAFKPGPIQALLDLGVDVIAVALAPFDFKSGALLEKGFLTVGG